MPKFQEIYLKPKGFDLCIFEEQNDSSQYTLAFDSQLNDEDTTYRILNDNTIVLRAYNNHYDIIEDLGN